VRAVICHAQYSTLITIQLGGQNDGFHYFTSIAFTPPA